jgi:hypothetical protein
MGALHWFERVLHSSLQRNKRALPHLRHERERRLKKKETSKLVHCSPATLLQSPFTCLGKEAITQRKLDHHGDMVIDLSSLQLQDMVNTGSPT